MNYRRKFRRGAPRTCGDTCCVGVLSVLGLMVVLLGPLLLFSSASPLAGNNGLTGAEAHLRLVTGMREAGGGQAASATFDLGAISSYSLAALPPSAPLLSSHYHYWRCLVVGTPDQVRRAHPNPNPNPNPNPDPNPNPNPEPDPDPNPNQCGYAYLLGSRSATHQMLQLGRPCAAALG